MRTFLRALGFLLLCAAAPLASAHAFPTHSSPEVGATLTQPPAAVKVWFDGELEPVFSTLIVKNAAGQPVGTGKGQVGNKNHALLETALPAHLAPGKYLVYWSVIAHDGHHTEGHFAFTLK
ncbi:MAG: copper resistance protein CopC [Rhodanobacteraceae bacterium]|nr:MAG: copper resistance protein CopC [Rhodanobacteraceae bacterium]